MSVDSEEGTTKADDDASLFLQHLPTDTPVYSFKEWQKEEGRRVFPENNNFVIIKNVPPAALDKNKFLGKIDYSRTSKVLILRMPAEIHETAADNFGALVVLIADRMRVRRRIAHRGSTRTNTKLRSKESDRSWAPAYRPGQTYREWPTVALEVGNSESKAKLMGDITWWLNQSNGQVQQGIIIDIKREFGNVYISSWVAPNVVAQPAAPGGPVPVTPIQPRQNLEAVFKRGPNGRDPLIEGDDITIPFASLVGENPGQGEGDFVFTKGLLRTEVVEPIWQALDAKKLQEADKKKGEKKRD
ncbi:hypothetical protein PISL3812_01003 [Talaromyces islandicus]|uniref:Uncharacterized protein n=1 Tax=Talaromyces islandicus TaxID=28573 RepID=A0A0U1LKW9_TALIS|nr:hypothetical protein PISL3812_01003 [Talaromyces islandicus]